MSATESVKGGKSARNMQRITAGIVALCLLAPIGASAQQLPPVSPVAPPTDDDLAAPYVVRLTSEHLLALSCAFNAVGPVKDDAMWAAVLTITRQVCAQGFCSPKQGALPISVPRAARKQRSTK